MYSGGSILCLCVRERERACECDYAFIRHAVAYSVWQLERAGAGGRPTGIKKPLSVGCISQWAEEPRGTALLIKAGVVCQCRHMMHSTITVGGKRKHESKIAATPATNLLSHHGSKTSYYSNDWCSIECQYQFALCYSTSYQIVSCSCTRLTTRKRWAFQTLNMREIEHAVSFLLHSRSSDGDYLVFLCMFSQKWQSPAMTLFKMSLEREALLSIHWIDDFQ